MADNRYCIEYAKTGRSGCKKCKSQIEKGVLRIGKITTNPFSDDGGDMKVWYHTRCMFETLAVRKREKEGGREGEREREGENTCVKTCIHVHVHVRTHINCDNVRTYVHVCINSVIIYI